MGLTESPYQRRLIATIERMYPEAIILKTDPNYIQGFPDLLVLAGNRWAALEVKKSIRATTQPNQEYYVSLLDEMSFGAFVYPENEREILSALQRSLPPAGPTRISRR